MLRILLVDDDAEVLDAVGDWLRRKHHVTPALGFPQAVLALANGPVPDMVITDLDMPPYSGEDLLAVLAARFPSVCRVLHTGSARNHRLRTVAHHVLEKGCELDELDAVVAHCERSRRVA